MLNTIYEQWRSRGRKEIAHIADAFNPPLLVRQPDDWINAIHRVAYIPRDVTLELDAKRRHRVRL